jgi:serine/threonine protein kinase
MIEQIICSSYLIIIYLLGCGLISKLVDVWSVGCILAAMLLGRHLFSGKSGQFTYRGHYYYIK